MAFADHILMNAKTHIDHTSGHEMLSVFENVSWYIQMEMPTKYSINKTCTVYLELNQRTLYKGHSNEADTHLLSIQVQDNSHLRRVNGCHSYFGHVDI